MFGSTLRRTALLLGAASAAPLALAQEAAELHEMMMPFNFIVPLAGLGMLFVVLIVGVVHYTLYRQQRDRLALIERLVATDKPVPRELLTGEKTPLPLPEERRRDIRRGITLLCWAIAVAAIPVIGSGGQWRYGVWGLLFLLPSLGSFFKAWLTAREIARGASSGSSQP